MEKTKAQEIWPQKLFVMLMTKVLVPLFFIFIFSVVQVIRIGFFENDYALLLLGSLLSTISVFAYTMTGYIYGAAGRRSYLAMLLTSSGFIPWAFGIYLTFYRGFWSLIELQNGFEFLVIIKSVTFIFLGYFVVSNFYKITETDKAFLDLAKKGNLIPDRDA